jgi:hypothetical protein
MFIGKGGRGDDAGFFGQLWLAEDIDDFDAPPFGPDEGFDAMKILLRPTRAGGVSGDIKAEHEFGHGGALSSLNVARAAETGTACAAVRGTEASSESADESAQETAWAVPAQEREKYQTY